MRKFFTLFFLFIMSGVVIAQTEFSIDNITYQVKEGSDNELKIVHGDVSSKVVVIPEKVTYENKEYTVTMVGISSFQNASLTHITLPNSIDTIGVRAFDSSALKSIIIPDNVKIIEKESFESCQNLISVAFGKELKEIKSKAFFGCDKLRMISLLSSIPPKMANSWTDFPFSVDGRNCKLYVPHGTKDAYKATCWSHFYPIFDTSPFLIDGLVYQVKKNANDEVEVVNSVISGEIVIPEKVIYKKKEYTVTMLANASFKGTALTQIILPNSIDTIGERCFEATHLEKIVLPNSVRCLGAFAFSNCNRLRSVNIPTKVDVLNHGVFFNTGLTEFHIPSTVLKIGSFVFSGTSIEHFTVADDNPAFKVVNEGLYSADMIELFAFPSKKMTSCIIPEGVKIITGGAFRSSDFIDVTLPSSLIYIGNDAFSFTQIKEMIIPDKVRIIGRQAFTFCRSLKKLILGEDLYEIHRQAFAYTAIEELVIPNKVSEIAVFAFYNCEALTKITIGKSVKRIGQDVFSNCKNLKEVNCLSVTPPKFNIEAMSHQAMFPFQKIDLEHCKLCVPHGTLAAYKATDWSRFKNCVEMQELGLSQVAAQKAKIEPIEGGVMVNPIKVSLISIYTLNGQCIYQRKSDSQVVIPLDKGVYLVKVNNVTIKICIP